MQTPHEFLPLRRRTSSEESQISIPGTPSVIPLIVQEKAETAPVTCWQKLKSAYHPIENLRSLFVTQRSGSGALNLLDGIRAFAILWVIALHTWWALEWKFWDGTNVSFNTLALSVELRAARNGDMGVDMFFVLSGFLIAHMLIQEHKRSGTISIWKFYVRRWLRIFPAYALVLALYWGLMSVLNSACPSCNPCNQYGWTNLLFLNNIIGKFDLTCMVWTWSIAVEVQFYLFSPFIVMLVVRKYRVGVATIIGLVVASLTLIAVLVSVYDLNIGIPSNTGIDPPSAYNDIVYNKVYTRMAPYLLGMLVAVMYHYSPKSVDEVKSWYNKVGWAFGLVLSVLVMGVDVFFAHGYNLPMDVVGRTVYLVVHRTLLGGGLAFIIYAALRINENHGVLLHYVMKGYHWVNSTRPAAVVAALSYSAYLVHIILIQAHYTVRDIPNITYWMYLEYFVENTLMTFAVALPLHILIEKPIMNLRF